MEVKVFAPYSSKKEIKNQLLSVVIEIEGALE
jgi:hypothetical protein